MTDWLRARARSTPDALAVQTHRQRLSFGQLDSRALRTARRLAGFGVSEGSRVALLLRNSPDFAVLTHALPRLGAVMVPLNTRLAAPELAWQITDSRASVLIGESAQIVQTAAATRTRVDLRSITIDDLDGAAEVDAPLRDRVDLSAVQGIIYTSATSGRPKGVMLTFGNHWWNAIGSALHLGLHTDDRWLALLPLYHVGGLAILWRSVIYGVPVVIHESFDADAANREIDEGGITQVSVVSTMLQRMLHARGRRPYPESLRCVLLGGGPAPAALLEACARIGVPAAPTYGLTEAASQVATLHPRDLARKGGSAGRALIPAEVRIEAGEILVRGPSVMAGYADRPDDTALALRGGWLHTGDLGFLDDEGYLYVLDRRDDLIITGGENVYPSEVEAVLREYPAVEDAGVIGLPDPEWGEVVAAAVVERPGARVREAEVKAFCQTRLARFKVPARLWIVDALPRSPAGKVLRRVVREQIASRDGSSGQEPILSAAPSIRRAWVRDAFHTIAGRYDVLNHVLSGGIHLLWKREAVRAAVLHSGDAALDVCCGTGDMLLGLARAVGGNGRAIGIDFAPGMLAGAARRLSRARSRARVGVLCADAEALPLLQNSIDAATFAFGLRNVARPARALAEVYRTLRPGGRLVVLEFGQPRSRVPRALYDLYSRMIIPRLGGWLSGRRDAYQYLHDSIRQWTDPPALAELMRQAGFKDVRYRLLTGGIAVLHVGVKANDEGGA